jgi:low affinity Fe/Cu permease
MNEPFRKFARMTSHIVGSSGAFITAVLIIVVWLVTGPIFHYSDTWQLAINTGTTIITFLMVFLIQNTQNRDAQATHLKLDELLRAVGKARTGLVDLEDLADADLNALADEFRRLGLSERERIAHHIHPTEEEMAADQAAANDVSEEDEES